MNEQSTESPAVGIIIAIFFIALLSFIIFMLVMTTKARHNAKKNMKMFKKGIFQPVKATFAHAAGLPISPGVMCNLHLTENGLNISSNGANFNVDISKITSIETKTDTDIQTSTQHVSSAGGAVAGALMFGIPGALIGGRTKTKKSTVTTHKYFMIVTYRKEDSVDYLAFVIPTIAYAANFINNFSLIAKNNETKTIEL